MQGDKLLMKNKTMKNSKFSKNKIGWYSELFVFPKTPEVNKNSDGKPAAEKLKRSASPTNSSCENCPVLQLCISQLKEELTLKKIQMLIIAFTFMFTKTIFFQLQKQSALDKISELEKQLLDFQQKHAILREELLDAKKQMKLYKLKFASKCSASSKASKPREDPKNCSKEVD